MYLPAFPKIIAGLLLMLLCPNAQAQTYYGFSYKGSVGLTNSNSKEIVKAEYHYSVISEDGRLQVFRPKVGANLPELVLDRRKGTTNTSYNYAFLDNFIIEGGWYHIFLGDRERSLQNAATGQPLKTEEDVWNIENLGSRYLIAKYYPKEEPRPKPQSKKGEYIPPPVIKPPAPLNFRTHYVVYRNALPLKAILRIAGGNYTPLYDTRYPEAVGFPNPTIYSSANFDYLLFQDDKTVLVYDTAMKLVKKIPYPTGESGDESVSEAFVKETVSKVVGKPLYTGSTAYPPVGAYSSILSPPSVGQNEPGEEVQVKKRDKFEMVKSPAGRYQLLRTTDEKVVFYTPLKFSFRIGDFQVTIEDKDDAESSFYVNRETGKPFLPQRYAELLKIQKAP